MTRPGKWEPMTNEEKQDRFLEMAFPGCFIAVLVAAVGSFGLIAWAIIELVQWVTSK